MYMYNLVNGSLKKFFNLSQLQKLFQTKLFKEQIYLY